jgi:anion-transporting  ArsA/GET3 family ATPase
VVVVTIDPARRLADALGLADGDADEPHRVHGLGPLEGTLDVLMLDAERTFDRLILDRAGARADTILQNPIYRSIAGSLAGAQEYMAIERLHQLHESAQHDLVVIDTPPSRDAVDILSAPDRLTTFFGHPVYRVLTAPGRTFGRVTSPATAAFAWTVRRLAGPEIVADTIDFFRSLSGIEDGLSERAGLVSALLRGPETGFVLVSSPRSEAIDEATHLGHELVNRGYRLRGVIANLVHPLPPTCDLDDADVPAGSALADQLTHHRELTSLATDEREELDALWAVIDEARMGNDALEVARCEVPLLDHDVHGLDALAEIADLLAP